MTENAEFVVVTSADWASAEDGVRASAPPARLGGRIAGIAAFVVLAVPTMLLSEGTYRFTNLLYVGVAALVVGVFVHARLIDNRRAGALVVVRAAVVPCLLPRITVDELAMLVLTGGVWVGWVYLKVEKGDDAVRIVRPLDPSPEEFPGFVLGLAGPAM